MCLLTPMRRFLPTPPSSTRRFHFKSLNESLSSLLKKPPTRSNLQEATKLHARLLIDGQAPLLGSHLVKIYAHFGAFREALLAVRALPCLHNIACNDILRAYVDAALFSEAIRFFKHLVFDHGFIPDNYTCPVIFKACSGLFSIEEGREVRDLIRLFEFRGLFKPNAYTKCALIDMFSKCGSLDDARMVFDEMSQRERDLASWTAIICGTIHQGRGIEALRLFEMMRGEGVRPDSAVMAAVIPACGRLEAKETGMALQGFTLKSGFYSDLFVGNAIIDMYCKFGDTFRAYDVFCRMNYRDDISWRTLIAGYSQNSQYCDSLELFLEMINLGVKPSGISIASILPALGKLNLSEQGKLIHGFIIKRGFDFDVVVGSALVDMYSSCGLTEETEILLSIWSDWDIMIWNSAIAGHASVENYGFALGVFRKMCSKTKFKPSSITLMSILPVCTKLGALKLGMEVHCHAIRNSLETAVSVSNSVIDMYCKCGYLDLGVKVFDSMAEKDVVSYNTIISAYGFHGYANQALALFGRLKSLGIEASKATFVGLLSGCSHAGLVDEGRSLYNAMIDDYGIMPNMEHYSCVVDMLGRAGLIDDACSFIRAMPEEPDGNVVGCLLAACRVHNVTIPVDLFSDEILPDKLDDSGYYILVSNMYASTKRWKDASGFRALIKEKGLRKKPGKSWIRIGNCTHVFDARDTTHSDFTKIQEVLENLISEMKEWCGGYMNSQVNTK